MHVMLCLANASWHAVDLRLKPHTVENFPGFQSFKNNAMWTIKMYHLFYSSSNTEQTKKKKEREAKISKRHSHTISLSKDLWRKHFQLPSQQFFKDSLTEKKGLMEKKRSGEISLSFKEQQVVPSTLLLFYSWLASETPQKSKQTDRQRSSIITLWIPDLCNNDTVWPAVLCLMASITAFFKAHSKQHLSWFAERIWSIRQQKDLPRNRGEACGEKHAKSPPLSSSSLTPLLSSPPILHGQLKLLSNSQPNRAFFPPNGKHRPGLSKWFRVTPEFSLEILISEVRRFTPRVIWWTFFILKRTWSLVNFHGKNRSTVPVLIT